ncbi:unnamed protein product, partial [Brenthis ino]
MSGNFSSNFTFQNLFPLTPPPPPPPLIQEVSDQEYLKSFETCILNPKKKLKINSANIFKTKFRIAGLVSAIRDIKIQEKLLSGNNKISDEERKSALESIKINKSVIDFTMKKVTGTFIELNRKLLTRRASKRRRQKRRRIEFKEEKRRIMKQREENSRKIDENLQKIKEDIQRVKEEEDAKLQADVVLKEVLRKKYDAKKSIAKLEALQKLRLARQNTAKGKGQNVPEHDMATFQNNIERLKTLWIFKLSTYEVEEAQLRTKLDLNKDKDNSTEMERQVLENLAKWRKVLFDSKVDPQVDYNGDIGKFVAVRSQWDQYIDNGPESSPIPIGWVLPAKA